MLWDGFKFGMLLQLSIGPMCLFVFQHSGSNGLWAGLTCVGAIALIDAAYIALAGLGAAVLFRRERVRFGMKLFGCVILCLFGLNTLLGAFGVSLLPDINLFSHAKAAVSSASYPGIFLQGVLLTAANPLTILFWGGVFSAKAAERSMTKPQLFLFGLGCVLSTLSFLSVIALVGSVVNSFLPPLVLTLLNAAVGLALIVFGVRLVIKKEKKSVKS